MELQVLFNDSNHLMTTTTNSNNLKNGYTEMKLFKLAQTKNAVFISLALTGLLLLSTHSAWANKLNTRENTILVLGDSISAAYGMPSNQGWVALLNEYLLQHSDVSHLLVNASISGETTAGALKRLPKLLSKHQPHIVIIELGGNDGLRGFPILTLRKNLSQLITLSQTSNAKVLLTEMRIPPNYGPRYTQQFFNSYALLSEKYDITLVPFLLSDIATNPKLMQEDGIHPTAQAQQKILVNLLPYLQQLL
jgi:acyl-CoA thioesterase-1